MTFTSPTDPAVSCPAGAAAESLTPRGTAAVKPGTPVYPRDGRAGSTSAHWRWQARAACRTVDPELFYSPDNERGPEKAAREARAVAVCDRCPVRLDCLAAADRHGTWGGMSEDERESRRRRQARDRLAAQRRETAA